MKIGPEMFSEMKEIYIALGKRALTMSHYDLSEEFPDYSVEAWREFLNDDEIIRYINKERAMLSDIELNKLINNAGKTGQVGTAQMITAISKVKSNEKEKTGPIFIYNAVPLNAKQKSSPTEINFLDEDPFNIKEK